MPPVDDIQVGDLVNVPGGMYGTVKYLGVVAGKPGRFAGIELAPEHTDRGKNNGDVDGRKYFRTSVPGSGIFVPINNNKYVTKRVASPPTPPRSASLNFSKSIGPGSTVPRPPRFRRPSLPRDNALHSTPPPKLGLAGLRTPSAGARIGPGSGSSPNGLSRPRSPNKAPSRLGTRPPSRVSADIVETPASLRISDISQNSVSAEVQELKERVKGLENQLLERDQQLEEQAATLAEFQRTIEELEGSDALSIRAQLREKNERIAQLTEEFDSHRADFRSTLDTLEVAASETERVYEQRLDELMQQNRELMDHGEDVEIVAGQLKQLEELVSELEEGLEDARRGEAEARAEVEFLRGEVERTKIELEKERESAAAALKEAQESADAQRHAKELEQKDDEIRGLKAIIHSLSRGEGVNLTMPQNGLSDNHDSERIAQLEQRVREFENLTETKSYRIQELERDLQQLQLNGNGHSRGRSRSSTITVSPSMQRTPTNSTGYAGSMTVNHSHQLSDRTIGPNDWDSLPSNHSDRYQDEPHGRLEDMHGSDPRYEDDGHYDDNGASWCEICETSGHDILTCTSMFGSGAAANNNHNNNPNHEKSTEATSPSRSHTPVSDDTPTASNYSNGYNHPGVSPASRKTGRDAVLEGLKGIGGLLNSMAPVAGKASGAIDESKWCALCERDGHESIDCPFDE